MPDVIKGKSKQECQERVEAVLKRLNEHNVRVNEEKCQWPQESAVYLGHRISKDGIYALEERIKPILRCKVPSNETESRSYLGMINSYRKFLPDLSTLLAPLNRFLQWDAPWFWSPECQDSYERSKELLCSNRVLARYGCGETLVLSTDASPHGISLSAVLSYRDGNSERPILFSSYSLTEAQQGYSQIEKEALAIVTAVVKLHMYSAGRRFIWSSIKIHVKRWALTLGSYIFDGEYRKSIIMGAADALSRLPLPESDKMVNLVESPLKGFDQLNYEIIAAETEVDRTLKEVLQLTKVGWPDQCDIAVLKPYFKRRHSLSIEQGSFTVQ